MNNLPVHQQGGNEDSQHQEYHVSDIARVTGKGSTADKHFSPHEYSTPLFFP